MLHSAILLFRLYCWFPTTRVDFGRPQEVTVSPCFYWCFWVHFLISSWQQWIHRKLLPVWTSEYSFYQQTSVSEINFTWEFGVNTKPSSNICHCHENFNLLGSFVCACRCATRMLNITSTESQEALQQVPCDQGYSVLYEIAKWNRISCSLVARFVIYSSNHGHCWGAFRKPSIITTYF